MIKFLIIRFSSIGDIVLTTPVIRCLKNQVQNAQIFYLTKSAFAPMLEANPYITKVIRFENNLNQVIKELQAENFDYIIDLHRNIRSYRVKFGLKRMAFSLKKLNILKWVLVNFKKDNLPDVHIVDRYLETLSIFSVENDKKGADYFIPVLDQEISESLCRELVKPYIVIAVGGGHFTKQIPADKLAEIIKELNSNIILLGGIEDMRKSEEIIDAVKHPNILNLTGKLSINQSASVIKGAELIITPDTGIMHIASAFKKNIISVWGSTVPKFGYYPYQPGENSKMFEVLGLNCRPCSKIGFSSCPKKHFRCMLDQDYAGIINKANLLSNGEY
jgi:ADP-heptose:LPS heptosyltransferase